LNKDIHLITYCSIQFPNVIFNFGINVDYKNSSRLKKISLSNCDEVEAATTHKFTNNLAIIFTQTAMLSTFISAELSRFN